MAVAVPTAIGSMVMLVAIAGFLFIRNRRRHQLRISSDVEAFWGMGHLLSARRKLTEHSDLVDTPKKVKTNIGVVASTAPKASAWLEEREIKDRVKLHGHLHAVHINPEANHPLIDAWLVLGSIDEGPLEQLVATRKPLVRVADDMEPSRDVLPDLARTVLQRRI